MRLTVYVTGYMNQFYKNTDFIEPFLKQDLLYKENLNFKTFWKNVNSEQIFPQVSDDGPVYVAEILVNMTKESAKSRNSAMVKPCPPGERGEMQVYLGWFKLYIIGLKAVKGFSCSTQLSMKSATAYEYEKSKN